MQDRKQQAVDRDRNERRTVANLGNLVRFHENAAQTVFLALARNGYARDERLID